MTLVGAQRSLWLLVDPGCGDEFMVGRAPPPQRKQKERETLWRRDRRETSGLGGETQHLHTGPTVEVKLLQEPSASRGFLPAPLPHPG